MLDLSDDQHLTQLAQRWEAAIFAIAAGAPALPLWRELQSLKQQTHVLLSEASAKVIGGDQREVSWARR